MDYLIYQDVHRHGNKRRQTAMTEAGPEHLNESVLFHEEGPVARTQDMGSNKGSAPGKLFRINPFNRTSKIEDQFNPASWDDQFAFPKEITV